MLVRFVSKWKNPTIVLESKKTGKADGVTTEGKSVNFYSHFLDLDSEKDKEIVEELKKGKSFGVDYWLFDGQDVPKNITIHPQDARVAKAPSDAEKDTQLAQIQAKDAVNEKRLQGLEDKIGDIMDVLEKIASKVESKKK